MADIKTILSLLNSQQPEDIRAGAQLAADSKVAEAVPALLLHITSKNMGVLDAVESALRKIGSAQIVSGAIPYLHSNDATTRNIAMELLSLHGKKDVEALISLLHDDTPDIRIFASDILGSVHSSSVIMPLCHALLHDPDTNVRYQAAVSLGELGFEEAVPSLIQAMMDEEWVQFAAVEALTKLKAISATAALIKILPNASDLVASNIVDALGEMSDIKAVPGLLKLLTSAPTPLSNKIVKAIIAILGPDSLSLLGSKDCERLREYMFPALQDDDTSIQDAVIKGFASLGGDDAAKAIMQAAEHLIPEEDTDRIELIIQSLTKIGFSPVLQKALLSENQVQQVIALNTLANLPDRQVTTLLFSMFWQCPRDIQRPLIMSLAEKAFPDDQQFFIDVLQQHSDGNVIKGALQFLGSKGTPGEAERYIIPFLHHQYNDVKEAALEACISLRTPAIQEHCRLMSQEEDPIQRMMGVYALGFFDPETYFHELEAATNDTDERVRKVAVESLGRHLPLSERRMAAVKIMLQDSSPDVRMTAIEVLGAATSTDTAECFIQGLKDPDVWVRIRCIEKLGSLQVASSVPELVSLLHDPNHLIQIKVIKTLGEIGGETAFRALLEHLESEDPEIQEAVENAIKHIRRGFGE